MKITRISALKILKFIESNPNFYFPFKIICSNAKKGSHLYNIDFRDVGYSVINDNSSLMNFILEEDLRTLHKETIELMAQGFIDKIEQKDIVDKISNLAFEYRKSWKENLCESEKIEEYGFNEFIGGKAEAYEDCLNIIKKQLLSNQLLSMNTIVRELENIAQVFTTNKGIGISYSDIYFWKENATQSAIDKMSHNIIKIIDRQFDFGDEKTYLIAESIVEEIKAIL